MSSIFNAPSDFTNRLLKRFLPRIYSLFIKDDKFSRFIVSSTVVGLTNLVFLFIFYDVAKLSLRFSTALAFVAAFFVSFFVHRSWTFGMQGKRIPKQIILYFINTLIILNLNIVLVYWLTNVLDIWYILSQFIANIGLGIYNFFISKLVIFKNNDNDDETGNQ